MTSQTTSQAVARHVKVNLKDLNDREEIPNRTIYLYPPLFELKIGRASQTDKHLQPATSNAWFNLKVISREHAVLRVDPLMEEVYLKDTDSMHGTYLNGNRLHSFQETLLTENNSFQLGAEIVRGEQVYKPLELSFEVDWNPRSLAGPLRSLGDIRTINLSDSTKSLPTTHKNSFSVDYSEEEDEDEIEFIGESICTSRLTQKSPSLRPRTFSVPDSDDSDCSDVERFNDESAPSSPADDLEVVPKPNLSVSTPDEVTRPQSTLVEPDLGENLNSATELEGEGAETQDEPVEEDHESSSGIDASDHLSEQDSDCGYLAGPDEEEEQAFDDVHNDSGVCETNTTNRNHVRLPSPSDAALPKPSWYQPTRLAGISDIVDQTQQHAILCTDTYSPAPAPQMPQFQPFGYYSTNPWSNSDASIGFQGSYEHNFGSSMQGSHLGLQQSSGPYMFVPQQQVIPTLKPLTCCPTNTNGPSDKSSKVSINDIIDDVNPEVTCGTSKLKRKADEISTSNPFKDFHANLETLSNTAHGQSEPRTDNVSHVATAEPVKDANMMVQDQPDLDSNLQKSPSPKKSVTFSSEPVVIVSDIERPRKRQRIEEHGQGSNFFKYLATAVAGATVGAVGTVLGLAALPADYFL